LLFGLSTQSVCAQSSISGVVKDRYGEPIPGISVMIEKTGKGVATNTDGFFEIRDIQTGQQQLIISGIGFQKMSREISISPDEHISLDVILEEGTTSMDEVVIQGKSEAEELRMKGFSIQVIESRKQKNLTADINQVLKNTAGINLRESGGLGSGFSLSLNGLSGNQIRYFIDGVPMENFGSSLSLNNFQINLIDKLEVYKGVVPISLGADALGGAINIITGYRQSSFLDVAYTYGSFNTHRASVNGQFANQDKRYFIKLSTFINHSDNSYKMHDVPVYDLELGNYLGDTTIRRFHDQYTSTMFSLEAGLFGRKLADHLSVGITGAMNRKNYQHPDNNIYRVFGAFHTANQTYLVDADYAKSFGKLDIKAYFLAGQAQETVTDTSRFKYNWANEFIVREPDDPKGELFERRSRFILTDQMVRSQIGVKYRINPISDLNLSFTQNYLGRTGNDEVNEFNRSFESPNSIHKNLLGFSYTIKNHNASIEATAFAKNYWYGGRIITQDFEDNDIISEPRLNNIGYGGAISWHPLQGMVLKSSYEKAFRIPESYEILGDGIYVNPNPTLQPEKSHNLNVGSRFNKLINKTRLTTEVNYFYRFSQDFIRFNPLGPFGEYENLNNVKTSGIEGTVEVNYRDFISLNTNVTYQNLTDRTEFDEGLPNTNYQSRIPNIPYFFMNARLGVSPSRPEVENKVNFYWHTRYVHDFFLTWESLGNQGNKYIIPSQLTHDLQVEYSMKNGRYNISGTVSNLTDALVYDNFNIQRPGRAAYIKLRYFIR
jgi:outer membrane cobalamin receptor